MYGNLGIKMINVSFKVSCHCGIMIVFDVKYVTLESVYDSILCLSYILYVAPVTFQAIYQVVALSSALIHCIVGFIILCIFDFPWLGNFFAIFAGIGSLTTLISSVSWLGNLCPYQLFLEGRWLPVSDHEELVELHLGDDLEMARHIVAGLGRETVWSILICITVLKLCFCVYLTK